VQLRTALFGEFNVRNVLAALAACLTRGPLRNVAPAVLALRPPAGRFDVVEMPSRVTPGVIVDYAHTPESVEAALSAARRLALPGGTVHAIFGCGGNTWRQKRPMMGAAAVRVADRLTLTNDNARGEAPTRITADILRGISASDRHRVTVTLDRRQAIQEAVALASPGDVVALLGRGHERTLTVGTRTLALSDPREARRALDARSPSAVTPPHLRLSATAAIVLDAVTGNMLAGLHQDRRRFPASLVKLMTLLVALDAVGDGRTTLRSSVPISAYAAQTPHPRLACRSGSTLSLRSLLEALSVRSSNLAATAIAEHVGGSERAFVDAMNATARRLGLRQTRFATPHGLPHRDQYTTAREMARLFAHLLQEHPHARRLLSRTRITVQGREYQRDIPLLAPSTTVLAVKTGFTWEAGYNVAVAWAAGRTVRVGVVLSAVSRAASFADIRRLAEVAS
jgi:D-alanyl-D-alanine carboxypeptidase